MGEISDVFSDIMVNANSTSDIGFALNPSGGDMNNILAEASIVAEQRVTDNFPDVPMGTFNRNSSILNWRTYRVITPSNFSKLASIHQR